VTPIALVVVTAAVIALAVIAPPTWAWIASMVIVAFFALVFVAFEDL
jgi:hypothetical protein